MSTSHVVPENAEFTEVQQASALEETATAPMADSEEELSIKQKLILLSLNATYN